MDIANLMDIKLDEYGQPSADTAGDFLQTVAEYECIMQEIALEAQTQEGDLFVDEGFGWSLLDFLHAEENEITTLEIVQRIRDKLSWYDEIDKRSIRVLLTWDAYMVSVKIGFRFIGIDQDQRMELALDRINAEVIIL